jgi:nucleoside-triphosphatase
MNSITIKGDRRLLLLTGAPGVGKTTVIRRVAAALRDRHLGGFYTEEIRSHGQRQGFRLITFDGQPEKTPDHARAANLEAASEVIAHADLPKTWRVGKYGVAVPALDALVEKALALEPRTEVYLVDEIGKMECLSPRFIAAMRALLAGNRPVVATIALKGVGFIAEVKQLPQALLWLVTPKNRDQIPDQVLAWIEGCTP